MKKYFLIMIFLIGFMACNTQNNGNPVETEVPAFKKAIEKPKIQLIDIRTPEEYKTGHIAHAKNIDFLADDFAEKMESLDKNKPVYLYCRSGKRSEKAAKMLSETGFTVYDLKGGILAWKEANQKTDL